MPYSVEYVCSRTQDTFMNGIPFDFAITFNLRSGNQYLLFRFLSFSLLDAKFNRYFCPSK